MARRRWRQRRHHPSRRGFTLLEVLIAFTILAVSLAVVMQSFSTGFNSLEKAGDHAVATLQARSKLAELGQTISLEPGEQSGEFEDGSTWRMTVEPAAESEEAQEVEAFSVLVLFRVEVNVTKENRASVTLMTLRAAESLDF